MPTPEDHSHLLKLRVKFRAVGWLDRDEIIWLLQALNEEYNQVQEQFVPEKPPKP